MQYVRANNEMECFRGRIGWMLDFDENYGSDVRNQKRTCKFIGEVSQRRVNMAHTKCMFTNSPVRKQR